MGLLDKALHGAEPPPPPPRVGRGGFLAKADAASRQNAPATPVFPWADLDGLRAELADIAPTGDGILYLFERVSEALPLAFLALLLPNEDTLRLASRPGPASGSSAPLPVSILAEIETPGSRFSEASQKSLAKCLGITIGAELRGTAFESRSDSSLRALFAYSLPGSQEPSAEEALKLGELFLANPGIPLPSLFPSFPASSASKDLVAAMAPDQGGVAMLFDIGSLLSLARSSFPSIGEGAIESVILSVALLMVGGRGKAILVDGARLALVLSSATTIDPELALFQFRKSFSRSLAFLQGSEFPEGEAFALDPSEPGCADSLARFLAG